MKGEERMVSPAEVRIGEFVLVRSGERVPLDGVVIRGEGTVDESIITGDSEPRSRQQGFACAGGQPVYRLASADADYGSLR